MILLVLGAKLQGTEAIYLGKKAGYEVWAIDQNPDAPGVDLADRFFCADLFQETEVMPIFEQVDVILPAMEDTAVLETVQHYAERLHKKLLFDLQAYRISSSKEASNRLFEKIGLPMPGTYPDCTYPVIVKPDNRSGSESVMLVSSEEEVKACQNAHPDELLVVQEYLSGPSYSLEVIGDGNEYFFPQITEVITDESYDCKRIMAPALLSEDCKSQMYAMAKKLAEQIKIRGIFDIEVIEHNGTLKILEIDARLPSQTPISVYHSTGINMVQLLVETAQQKSVHATANQEVKCCLYQQVCCSKNQLTVLGEHILSDSSHLKLIPDFFGADEAMTDFEEGSTEWKAIVIITRKNKEEAYKAFVDFAIRVKEYRNQEEFQIIEG